MNFELSEEQRMLKKAARDFLEKECPEKLVREMEEHDEGYSPSLWHKTADLGWLGIVYPEEYGGTGGSILDLAVLYEEMGRALFPSPHLSTVVLCGMTILNAGSEEQKAHFLPEVSSGNTVLALALTEPAASWGTEAWDAEGVTLQATRHGSQFELDGIKLFVHDASIAQHLLVAARTKKGTTPEDGVTLFLVDAKNPKIAYTPLKTTAGDRQSEVAFAKVSVPESDIVGQLHGGWAPLAKSMKIGAVMLCAEMVGAGWRLLELAVDYAKSRIQFDAPIGVNQYVQEFCTNLLASVDGSKNVTYQAAWKLSEGLECDFEVAAAKAWTSDAHENACWNAHQVLAGVGYAVDAGVIPLYSRRAKSQQLYLGDTAYHLKKIALQLDRWPEPAKPRGEARGLWKTGWEEQLPAWAPWRQRWETIERRKQERKQEEAQG